MIKINDFFIKTIEIIESKMHYLIRDFQERFSDNSIAGNEIKKN